MWNASGTSSQGCAPDVGSRSRTSLASKCLTGLCLDILPVIARARPVQFSGRALVGIFIVGMDRYN